MQATWNYSFSVPCALLMLTLLVFYFSRPRLPLRLNHTFLTLLALQLLVMIFDLVSTLADEHYSQFDPTTLYVLNTLFFVLFIARIFCFFVITLDLLHIYQGRLLFLSIVPFVIFELICVSSFLTGAVFRIEDGMYHSGPLYNSLYVCSFFYLALSVIMIVRNSEVLGRRRYACALGFNLALVIGYIVRFTFPKLLVMNTFCMVAITIIYLAFVNPDLYLTPNVPAFNLSGFRETLMDQQRRKGCHILGFALKNYSYERGILGGRQMDQAIGLIGQYLAHTFPETHAFYLNEGRIALMGPSSYNWSQVRETLWERFQHPWQTGQIALSFNIALASVDSGTDPSASERVIASLLIALEEVRTSTYHTIDDEAEAHANTELASYRMETLRALERALTFNQIEVFLQPLFDARSRRIVAAEALARVRDDKGKLISPDIFIPIAEKSGFINHLGEQVFDKVCAFIASHDIAELGLGWINVNLSPIQCMQSGIADRYSGILERHGVSADAIHLEITEQSMVDYTQMEQQILDLQSRGFEFLLDDYGTGYSNPARAKRYPFSGIKLDLELVQSYSAERDDLLPAIVQGFKNMGMRITAEGIETPEMADALAGIGCDYLQGFLFSKPIPMQEFLLRYGS